MKILKLLKSLNILTSVLIVVLTIYVVANPFLPKAIFANSTESEVHEPEVASNVLGEGTKEPLPPPVSYENNRIIIPSIKVDASINEGFNDEALDTGMWRLPYTSTPDRGGNTVITGHRVLRTSGPNTFYNMHKVKMGDEVIIKWLDKEYIYKVYEIIIVLPDQREIEENTEDSILTLYTCTPAWTHQKRLVVKALLQE